VLVRFLVGVPIGALLGGALLRRPGPGAVAAPGLALAAALAAVLALRLGLRPQAGQDSRRHAASQNIHS